MSGCLHHGDNSDPKKKYQEAGAVQQKRRSERISRILLPLSRASRGLGGDHSSRRSFARPLERPTRSSNETGRLSLPIWACWRWGLPCRRGHPRRGALLPHLFTLTPDRWSRAVCFLWHFPSTRAGSPLATTVPCPVRTFLPADQSTCSPRRHGGTENLLFPYRRISVAKADRRIGRAIASPTPPLSLYPIARFRGAWDKKRASRCAGTPVSAHWMPARVRLSARSPRRG